MTPSAAVDRAGIAGPTGMGPVMVERQQRWCCWIGIGFMPMFLIGLGFVAGWIPPPAPAEGADEIAAMYDQDRTRIRVGVWILTAAAPLLFFYIAAISHQLRRIVGGPSALVTVQTAAGACLILEFIFPQLIWQAAAYREGRDAEDVLLFNDLGWLLYIGVVSTAMVQMIIVAVVVLLDPRPRPLLPRWCAYLNLWCALGVAAGGFVVFVHRGPIAWNGLVSWWLLAFAFFVWMVTMTTLMLRASHRAQAEAQAPPVEP